MLNIDWTIFLIELIATTTLFTTSVVTIGTTKPEAGAYNYPKDIQKVYFEANPDKDSKVTNGKQKIIAKV